MTFSHRHASCIAAALATLLTASAIADVTVTTATETETHSATTPLSATERRRAAVWELDEVEWQRYDTLLEGIRGSVSPASLSPLEVLGIHARDDAERRHYAERWARAMRDDAERILAFQRAYDAAFQRLFGEPTFIDVERLAGRPAHASNLQSDDRLLFFTGLDCPPCDAVFAKVLPQLELIDGVDVYFVAEATLKDQDIRDWAKRQKIDTRWVRSRRITLNLDDGVLRSIDADIHAPPLLFVQRGGAIRPLSYAEL